MHSNMMANSSSRTQSEFESEEQSLETTLPTDFTLSPESDDSKNGTKSRLSLKQQLERKQLIHDLQLLKIDLSHKSLVIDNMKAEYMAKMDDLEEKLADTSHQKQVVQARLESQLKLQQEDSKRRLLQTKQEMETILQKQQRLEETNARLLEKADEIKRGMKDLELTAEQYETLRNQPADQLSLRDYVAIKVYDLVWPLKDENEQYKRNDGSKKDEIRSLQKELGAAKEELILVSDRYEGLSRKYERTSAELSNIKFEMKDILYKAENYDGLKRSKEQTENELSAIKKEWAVLESSYQRAVKEKDECTLELGLLKQKTQLLQHDKEYLTKQKVETTTKLSFTDEKLSQVSSQLEAAKQAREELYERYINARDKYKNEYDERLKEEIKGLHSKTTEELDKLRASQKEVHEVELKTLREGRDLALEQKEKVETQLRELQTRYEEQWLQLKQMQSSDEAKLSDLTNELKLKDLELERARIVEMEITKNFKELQIETEKLQKKVEVLTSEMYEQQNKFQLSQTQLELQLKDKIIKLDAYEKLEQDLDDIVMHAAEIGDDSEAERILFSYGYGATVATNAKRRLQQSVHLARRVLAIEKLNTQLTKNLEDERGKLQQMSVELNRANDLLQKADQPYNYLIESVKLRDQQLSKLKSDLKEMETNLRLVTEENKKLMVTRNQLVQDLERLLNQREQLVNIKRILMQLGSVRAEGEPAAMQSSSSSSPSSSFTTSDETYHMNQELPQATIFTK